MRKLLSIAVIGMFAICLAGMASANVMRTSATTGVKLGFGKVGTTTATGVVTINGSGVGQISPDHLTTLRVAPSDPMDSEPVPVTDPETTGTVASNIVDAAFGRGGVFAPISGAAMSSVLTQDTMALAGIARVCLVVAGCGQSLPLVLTQNNGAVGVGVGGIITVGYPGPVRISLVNSPWQIHPATRLISTANGVLITRHAYRLRSWPGVEHVLDREGVRCCSVDHPDPGYHQGYRHKRGEDLAVHLDHVALRPGAGSDVAAGLRRCRARAPRPQPNAQVEISIHPVGSGRTDQTAPSKEGAVFRCLLAPSDSTV